MRAARLLGPALLGAACLAFAWAAAAQESYRDGRSAFDAGRHTDAARIWIPLAIRGDLRAQFGLATLYAEGRGVPQDHEQSAYWFARAAEQGLPAAQFNLGNAYHHGRGVPRDEQEALDWYRRAAANGHPRAQEIVARAPAPPPAPDPEPPALGPAEPDKPRGGFALNGPDWLLARDPSHYTLQLVAMSERPRIARFVRAHGLEGELAVFQFERDRVRYFALLIGDYPDRIAARRARAALPLEVQAGGPWIRPLAEVQGLIRAEAQR